MKKILLETPDFVEVKVDKDSNIKSLMCNLHVEYWEDKNNNEIERNDMWYVLKYDLKENSLEIGTGKNKLGFKEREEILKIPEMENFLNKIKTLNSIFSKKDFFETINLVYEKDEEYLESKALFSDFFESPEGNEIFLADVRKEIKYNYVYKNEKLYLADLFLKKEQIKFTIEPMIEINSKEIHKSKDKIKILLNKKN